eukprot:453775-Rhodomonas_salina.2
MNSEHCHSQKEKGRYHAFASNKLDGQLLVDSLEAAWHDTLQLFALARRNHECGAKAAVAY